MSELEDVPTAWSEDELAEKNFAQLRERFSKYAELAPAYETAFNAAFASYNEREAVYVKIFGKLAVIEDARDFLFQSRPGDTLVAGNERLILGVTVMAFTVIGGALIKIANLIDTVRDLSKAQTGLSAGRAAVKIGAAQGKLLRAQQFAVVQLEKIRAIRGKRIMWGGVALAIAGVSVFFQVRNMVEAEKEMKAAIPAYAEWFAEVSMALTDLNGGVAAMNADIEKIISDTSTGNEATLISYLDQAIGDIGQFQALVNSATEMINDTGNNLSDAQIAQYTGLPVEYIEQLRLQS